MASLQCAKIDCTTVRTDLYNDTFYNAATKQHMKINKIYDDCHEYHYEYDVLIYKPIKRPGSSSYKPNYITAYRSSNPKIWNSANIYYGYH